MPRFNRKGLVLIVGGAAAVLLLLTRGAVLEEDAEDEPTYEAPDLIDQAGAIFQEVTDMVSSEPVQQNNLSAFLWMIRVSEGTDGTNGYSTLVGGGLFDGFADHPRILVDLPKLGIKSSAAGAYQILRRTWDGVRDKLGLQDFSPASQDAAAAELIRQRGALADVNAGRFAVAVDKCKKEWASLPGAGYGQRENSLARLQTAYTQAGGTFA
jgi:muramidase (phage lysozyme)